MFRRVVAGTAPRGIAWSRYASSSSSSQSPASESNVLSKRESEELRRMVRVDLAGEVAAVRICEAQLAWISPLDDAVPIVKEIIDEELVHRQTMKEYCDRFESTPTVLDPLFALGAAVMGGATAVLGKDAMMCCHAAVEETITEHYNDQLRSLTRILDDCEAGGMPITNPSTSNNSDFCRTAGHSSDVNEEGHIRVDSVTKFRETVRKFRDEEMHHQELGENNGAANAPFYSVLHPSLVSACKFGIFFGQRY